MLKLATQRDARFDVDDREIKRAGNTYTYDTLAEIRQERGPDLPLVFLAGTDAFAKIDTWHRWTELFELAHFAVAVRANDPDWFARGPGTIPRDAWPRITLNPKELAESPAGRIMTFAMDASCTLVDCHPGTCLGRRLHPLSHTRFRGRFHPHPTASTRNENANHTRQEKSRHCRPRGHQGPRHPGDRTCARSHRSATGSSSPPQIRPARPRALSRHVRDALKEAGSAIIGTEGEESGEWILVDAGDIVAHVMQPAVREYYSLEELWSEGRFDKVLNSTAPVATKRPASKARRKTRSTRRLIAPCASPSSRLVTRCPPGSRRDSRSTRAACRPKPAWNSWN